jgi:hypothetical protein
MTSCTSIPIAVSVPSLRISLSERIAVRKFWSLSCGLVAPTPTFTFTVTSRSSSSSVIWSTPKRWNRFGLLAGQRQDRRVILVALDQLHHLAQHRLDPRLDQRAQLVGGELRGILGQDVHAADRLVELAVGLHRRLREGAGQVVEVEVQPVLLFVGRAGDVLGLHHLHVALGVVHHRDRRRHVALEAAQVDHGAALREIALVHRELTLSHPLVRVLVQLALNVAWSGAPGPAGSSCASR